MLNKALNAIFSRPRPEPHSAEYKAGYASGLTVASLIRAGRALPTFPAGILPERDRAGRLERRVQRRIAGCGAALEPASIR